MTANKNPNVSQEAMRMLHHPWAKGFKKGNSVVYHPYTRIDFVFGENDKKVG